MTSPSALARAALDTICEAMPADLQPAHAPVEARRHLIGMIEPLPRRQQDLAIAELERLIDLRFGPQGLPSRSTPSPPPVPDQAMSVEDDLALAVADAFSTTFDGTTERAEAISRRAMTECERVLKNHGVGIVGRWRARRLCRALIADERAQLFYNR